MHNYVLQYLFFIVFRQSIHHLNNSSFQRKHRFLFFIIKDNPHFLYDYSIKVTIHNIEYMCHHVIVANVPRYGGPFRPAPDAIYNDGEFDIVMYIKKGRRNMLRYGWKAICGSNWANDDDILRIRTDKVMLESEEPVSLQCDGDPDGVLPRECRVVRDGATFLVP